MKSKKFWNWKSRKTVNQEKEEHIERILELNGTIAEESWFDDDVTPQLFKDELNSGEGDVTVWINSLGGDCVAAAQIYNMLVAYKGNVTVKIDGIAASAASVIAMAGDKILMSPVSLMMIHNPITGAYGDHEQMQKTIELLNEVKESIINAYVIKTGLSRAKLSRLMDQETWMNATKAVELGFADDVIRKENNKNDEGIDEEEVVPTESMLFSYKTINNALQNKLEKHYGKPKDTVADQAKIDAPKDEGTSAKDIKDRLNFMKRFI